MPSADLPAVTPFTPALTAWKPFAVARFGAGAVLFGLPFVGLSPNLSRILANPALPLRAEVSLMPLALQIVLSSIMLIPDQGPAAISLSFRRTTPPAERRHGWQNLAFL